jgi:hypothetical protein
MERAASVANIERMEHPPGAALVERDAAVLDTTAADLLLGVPTRYDRLRWPHLSDEQLESLLAGLQLMPRGQLDALVKQGRGRIAQLPEPLVREGLKRGRVSTPATQGRDTQVGRKRKGA